MASVSHQPPVSSLATVDAHLVPEGETHLQRIFDSQKFSEILGGISRSLRFSKAFFWDSYERGRFEIGDHPDFGTMLDSRFYGKLNNSANVNCNIMD